MGEKERSHSFFNEAGIETLLCEAETYQRQSYIAAGGDRIAELLLVRLFDVIRSVAYLEIKIRPESRQVFGHALRESLSADAERRASLCDRVFAVNEQDDMLQEIFPLLEGFRQHYLFSVRSPLSRCWENSLPSQWRRDSHCASYQDCREKELFGESIEKCNAFYSSWRDTSLSLPQRENLRSCPTVLAAEVYDRCHPLKILTERPWLEEYLARSYMDTAGTNGNGRSVHGLVVRLLTMCIDYYLGVLNRRLEPATGKKWYFLDPVPDAVTSSP